METQKKVSLSDVLNYNVDTYLNSDELNLIYNTFNDARVLKVLRKILLPSVGDIDLPLEEMSKDVWLVGRDYAAIPDAEIKSIVLARQEAIRFIMGGLIQLKVIANTKKETTTEKALRQQKNSSK